MNIDGNQMKINGHQMKMTAKRVVRAVKALKAALDLFASDREQVLARSGEARALHGLASAWGRLEELNLKIDQEILEKERKRWRKEMHLNKIQ